MERDSSFLFLIHKQIWNNQYFSAIMGQKRKGGRGGSLNLLQVENSRRINPRLSLITRVLNPNVQGAAKGLLVHPGEGRVANRLDVEVRAAAGAWLRTAAKANPSPGGGEGVDQDPNHPLDLIKLGTDSLPHNLPGHPDHDLLQATEWGQGDQRHDQPHTDLAVSNHPKVAQDPLQGSQPSRDVLQRFPEPLHHLLQDQLVGQLKVVAHFQPVSWDANTSGKSPWLHY